MSVGREIIQTAFFDRGRTAPARAFHVLYLSMMPEPANSYDDAVMQASDAYRALLLDQDPQNRVEGVFERLQKVSSFILNKSYVGTGMDSSNTRGMSGEVAIHNLAWWGVAKGFGRYARLVLPHEDQSGIAGRKDGYDVVLRTDARRHRLQVKSRNAHVNVHDYEADITVVSPDILLKDRSATDLDLHEAIRDGSDPVLDRAWNSLVQELRTQKAPNGVRQVI